MVFDWSILALPTAAILRNLSGWAENAIRDGKVSDYEWKQLGATTLRVLVVSASAMFGMNLEAEQAAGLAVLADYAFSALRKAGKSK